MRYIHTKLFYLYPFPISRKTLLWVDLSTVTRQLGPEQGKRPDSLISTGPSLRRKRELVVVEVKVSISGHRHLHFVSMSQLLSMSCR